MSNQNPQSWDTTMTAAQLTAQDQRPDPVLVQQQRELKVRLRQHVADDPVVQALQAQCGVMGHHRSIDHSISDYEISYWYCKYCEFPMGHSDNQGGNGEYKVPSGVKQFSVHTYGAGGMGGGHGGDGGGGSL